MRKGDIVTIVPDYYRFCYPAQLAIVMAVHKRKGLLSGMIEVVIGPTEGCNVNVYLVVNREDLEVIGHYDDPFMIDPNTGVIVWDTLSKPPSDDDKKIEEEHWKALSKDGKSEG